jgi:acyl-CoA synthetase (NDP forming)
MERDLPAGGVAIASSASSASVEPARDGGRGALYRALLAPRSVALIGASDDPAKTTGRPLRFLRQAGYAGRVYPINPKRDTVLGERAWASLDALPEVPEHAYILTPTDLALDALEACAAKGVAVATILAAGFSESGPEGLAREARVREIVARTGIRVVGPSGLGIVNVHEKLVLTANAAFAEPDLTEGGIFAVSHSGSMIGALVSRGKARGVGYAGLVSVGNEVDLSVGEICSATLDNPRITGYMLFLETLRHADALRRFAFEAARRGKPVIAYKLGRSAAGAELAVSHTGALAGEDDVADAFLKDCGIARVGTLEALFEGLPLLAHRPLRRPSGEGAKAPRVAVVTTTGGGAAMVVDQLGVRGIGVEQPGAATLARLKDAGVDVAPGRIVDLTLAGTRYDIMSAALKVLRSADEFDLVVAVAGSSARFNPDLVVRPIIDSARQTDGLTPLAAFIVPDAPVALASLTAAGVPCFRTPESCADAIAAAFGRRAPRPVPVSWRRVDGARLLDEAEGYALLRESGIASPLCTVLDVARLEVPGDLVYPVAVKVLSAAIPHKSDVGGVSLGIADEASLRQAVEAIVMRVAQSGAGVPVERVLVQPMVKGLGEVLVGYRVDSQVGPIVMLAAGGVFTEIYRDRALRLAPIGLADAFEMIGEVRGLKALAGYRGKARGDLEALAEVLVAISRLALRDGAVVLEAEINPLLVMPQGEGVVPVDALVRLADG